MNHEGRPLLSDFGVSRIIVESVTITGTASLKGNLRYMAPELLKEPPMNPNHKLHTKESDVWAFGMVLYVSLRLCADTQTNDVLTTSKELLSGNVPYDHLKVDAEVVNAINSVQYPSRPQLSTREDFDEMWYICSQCWWESPRLRPKCSRLVNVSYLQ